MSDLVGQQLGNYCLTHLLGQGGFADVYLAEHIHLGRQAAVKVLQMRLVGTTLEQFRNEARVIAGLIHPNIVRVLDFGVDSELPFLVMDYAPNGTLRQKHQPGIPLTLPTIISYVKQAAAGLQFAHDRRLVHRDIKPENLLLGSHLELLLSDFGLALLSQSSQSGHLEEMAGTAHYMAPEQFQGKPRRASDQYALAIITYEWLCGERPFQGTFLEVASQHMLVPPPPLRSKLTSVSPMIEEVIRTALAKEPEQRFHSVQAFANAFEQAASNFDAQSRLITLPASSQPAPQADTPVPSQHPSTLIVSPEPPILPITRQAMRQTAINTPSPSEASPQNQPAAFARERPSQPQASPMQTPDPPAESYFPYFPKTSVVEEPTRPLKPRRGLSRRAVTIGLAGLLTLGLAGGAAALIIPGLSRKPSWGNSVLSLPSDRWGAAWSPDSTRIALGGHFPAIPIYDVATGGTVFTYAGHSKQLTNVERVDVTSLAWSPDGTRVASIATVTTLTNDVPLNQPDIQVWEANTGKLITTFIGHNPRPGRINIASDISWSPDGKRLVTAGAYDKTAKIWDAATGKTLVTYQGHKAAVGKAQWSPDGQYIASATFDSGVASSQNDIQVWDSSGKRITTYVGDGSFSSVRDLVWSPDSQHIASVGDEGTIWVWEALTGQIQRTFTGISPLSWSPDGKFIAALAPQSDGWSVSLFEVRTGERVSDFTPLTGGGPILTWSPDGTYIAAGGGEGGVTIWQVTLPG